MRWMELFEVAFQDARPQPFLVVIVVGEGVEMGARTVRHPARVAVVSLVPRAICFIMGGRGSPAGARGSILFQMVTVTLCGLN